MRVGRIVREEHELGAAASAEPDLVAMPQRPLGDLLVVDERAAARPAILQHEPAVFELNDLGVLARHVGADRAQIALALAADAEDRLVDDDDTAAERIVDLKARTFRRGCPTWSDWLRLEYADFDKEPGEIVHALSCAIWPSLSVKMRTAAKLKRLPVGGMPMKPPVLVPAMVDDLHDAVTVDEELAVLDRHVWKARKERAVDVSIAARPLTFPAIGLSTTRPRCERASARRRRAGARRRCGDRRIAEFRRASYFL